MPALLATPPRPLDELTLPPTKLFPEDHAALAAIVGADSVRCSPYERAFHALGRSYHDLLRLRAGALESLPDAVVYPRSTDEVLALLAYCKAHRIGVIPFGGGTSVVGGVSAEYGNFDTIITIDLSSMDRLLDVDSISRTATAEAGIYGPALERGLNAKGFTLGHLPQSFEFSTLGGWICHRGAGQMSLRYGRAEDWLVGLKLATTEGLAAASDAPASAAGPQLKDIVAGSEGSFGIVTEATVRLMPLPEASLYRSYMFRDFGAGSATIRAAMQDDVAASMIRLSDVEETRFLRTYASIGHAGSVQRFGDLYLKVRGISREPCLMIAAFEGRRMRARSALHHFSRIAAQYGAVSLGPRIAERWRQTRFQAPYLRDAMMDRGVGVDTIETAASWMRLETVYANTRAALENAIRETAPREGARGVVMCHISHSYSDGASLYFTYVFPRALEGDIAQWKTIKKAATQAIVDNGGTVSHHHGVGEDHLPWMMQEKGPLGIAALRAIKKAFDPDGILNPGKLIPP
ncbi:MAG: FAD-binding oxidoreductase [Alphaproteobacteria bacterium]|nr:FAD-binding oxidoreductase [Alphaproteobacteria bacterium]